jgi:hypothetical protein
MARLFDRDVLVKVGTLEIERSDKGLPVRVAFDISKTSATDPNKATIKVWNLRAENRKILQESRELPVTIEAGYVGTRGIIFKGTVINNGITSSRDGVDWVTTIEAKDGGNATKKARVNKSYEKGFKLAQIAQDIAGGMAGVGLGNLASMISTRGLESYVNGFVASGKSIDVLKQVTKSLGYELTIQDEQIQVLQANQTTTDIAVKLTAGSGLIGSPEAGDKGIVKAKSLLNSLLFPGRKVQLISDQYPDGPFFKTIKAEHRGDTWGNDWASSVELKPL